LYIFKVAFTAMFIVDEGSTGVMRGARVRKEFRERGILPKLQATILKNHPFIEVPVPIQEFKRSCICVLGVSILPREFGHGELGNDNFGRD
jgi:hypothetical protein